LRFQRFFAGRFLFSFPFCVILWTEVNTGHPDLTLEGGDSMSDREQAKMIIDQLPDYKMSRILIFLKGVQFDDDIEDDLFCQRMWDDYVNDPDPEKDAAYTLEECKQEWGLA